MSEHSNHNAAQTYVTVQDGAITSGELLLDRVPFG